MPLPLLLAPILSALASNGLSILSNAIQAKGKEFIEEKIGVKIPSEVSQLTPELLSKLKEKEMEHEEFLITAKIKETEITIEAEKIATQEVTKRWEADMLSDSYLSKNIRPLSFAGTLIALFLLAILSAVGVKIEASYIALFAELAKLMTGAYFIGRSVEKSIDIYHGWKETKGN